MNRTTPLLSLAMMALTTATAAAASIVVQLPMAAHAKSATAVAKDPTLNRTGTVSGDAVTFADPKPATRYDVQVTLTDGTVLQGVDLSWYSRVPDRPNAEALTDDDRSQMNDFATRVTDFFKQRIVLVRGNHDRAVVLVDRVRDQGFHSNTGDEVIWRPEVWYFENHHGGWEKVAQTERVLRRERFATRAAYRAVVDPLRWVPELGGVIVPVGGPSVSITLPALAGLATASTDGAAGQGSATTRP